MEVKPDAEVPTKIFPAVPVEPPPIVPVQPVIVIVLPLVQETPLLAANLSEWALEPKAIVLELVRLSVDELVIVVPVAIDVVLNVPPFKTTCDAKVAVVELGLSLSSPVVMVVAPL